MAAHRIASGRFMFSWHELQCSPLPFFATSSLLFNWYFLLSASQILLPAMWLFPKIGNFSSFMQSSACWSSPSLLRQICYSLHRSFGVTVFIALVTDHGPVLIFVRRSIWRFSGDTNVVRSFWKIEGEQHSSTISVSCFHEASSTTYSIHGYSYFRDSSNSSLNS